MGGRGCDEVEDDLAWVGRHGNRPAGAQVLGDSEILSVAGAGAMGVVYRARQRALRRTVALKAIRKEIASVPEYRQRFLREARLAAMVQHPHVVSVYDAGQDRDRLYLLMQWVEGEDLRRLLDRCGRLAPADAVAIAVQLASALEAIHQAGLIHRDVKPANVIVCDAGGTDHAYLGDFGLARPSDAAADMTQPGRVVGSPGFLSPEQIEGSRPTHRSDLYALGCLLFEALTGEPPFTAPAQVDLLVAHATAARPKPSQVVPSLSTRYDQFFARALAIDPEQRFASAREFADELSAAHAGGLRAPTPASRARAGARPKRPGRVRTLLAGLAVVALGLAAAAVSVRLVEPARPRRQPAATLVGQGQGPLRPCGSRISAGAVTSCPFAVNVVSAYRRTSGARSVSAFSPVTGRWYNLFCGAGDTTVTCTSATGALIVFPR